MNEVLEMDEVQSQSTAVAAAPARPVAAQPARQVATNAFELVAQAAARGASMEELKAFIDLQERIEANEARKAYVVAMAEFKRNPPAIVKDKAVGYTNKDGSFTGYKHATLGSVCAAVVEGLGTYGFSHRWDTEQPDSGMIAVTCVITHSLGHAEVTRMEGPPDNSGKKNVIQQVASTITYLQRYTLLAACGLASHDQLDDDGQGGAAAHAEQATDGAGAATASAQPGALAVCSDEHFTKRSPEWRVIVATGKKTPAALIRFLSTRYTFTDAQKKTIQSWELQTK